MSANLSEFTVTKMHPVVHASYAMTVNEQRVLLACICQIDPRYAMPDGKTYILTVEQARDLFYNDKDASNVYKDLSRAVEKLYERDVKIALPNGDTLQTRFVQSIVWSPDNLQIQVKFADDIKPYLAELKNNFSSYKLKNIVQLTSVYAIRLYEWLVSWASQNQTYKDLTLDELREKLDLGEKYKQIGELKSKVIQVAVSQINENTDFQVDVSYKKLKREIRWIQFTFQQKPEIAKLENQRKLERKAIADHNRAAKIKREQIEREAAERQALLEARHVQELAEQEKQAAEQAQREQENTKAIELWELLTDEQQTEVQQAALQNVYSALQPSLVKAFEQKDLSELLGRFRKPFIESLKQFGLNQHRPHQLSNLPVRETPKEYTPRKQGKATITFSEKYMKNFEKQLLMYRDFKEMMNEDAIIEIETAMRFFKISLSDLDNL